MIKLSKIINDFHEIIEFKHGEEDLVINEISQPLSAHNNSLVFISDKSLLKELVPGSQRALVVSNDLFNEAKTFKNDTILISTHVKLAMALIGEQFFKRINSRQKFHEHIHPSSFVDPTATIAKSATIGPGAVIGKNVLISDNVNIGPNSVIEAGTEIGKNSYIHSQVFIGHDTKIGEDCEILPLSSIGSDGFGYATDKKGHHHRITHYGNVVIEDRVHIGSNVCIDRGTFGCSLIGEGTKIDNHCHLGHNIKTGKNCFITAGFISAGSAKLGNNNFFGGRTSVAGHITVCDNVHAAGVSTIHNDVKSPGAYGGYPFVELKQFFKIQASLVHLPKMRKQLNKIIKHLGLEDNN